MTEGGCNDHDLLIKVNEQLIALIKQFEEFTTVVKENNINLRADYTRQYDEVSEDLKEAKEQHKEDMKILRTEIDALKANMWKYSGAVAILSFMISIGIALFIAYYPG